MKTAEELAKLVGWWLSEGRRAEAVEVIEERDAARDAEHRAELDQCQTDLKSARHSLLQSDNQVARLVAENDRLKGELGEAKRLLGSRAKKRNGACAWCDSTRVYWNGNTEHTKECEYAKKFLAAPPPAESTPLCDCHKHKQMVCDVCQGVAGKELKDVQPAPPDALRERLSELDSGQQQHRGMLAKVFARLAVLEAKGEPGTHAFVFDGYHAVTRHCRTCGHPDGPPHHPKGAKP